MLSAKDIVEIAETELFVRSFTKIKEGDGYILLMKHEDIPEGTIVYAAKDYEREVLSAIMTDEYDKCTLYCSYGDKYIHIPYVNLLGLKVFHNGSVDSHTLDVACKMMKLQMWTRLYSPIWICSIIAAVVLILKKIMNMPMLPPQSIFINNVILLIGILGDIRKTYLFEVKPLLGRDNVTYMAARAVVEFVGPFRERAFVKNIWKIKNNALIRKEPSNG